MSSAENAGLRRIKTAIPCDLVDILIINLKHPIHQLSEIKEEENVLSTDKTIQPR